MAEDMGEDFLADLAQLKADRDKPKPLPVFKKKEPLHVELTLEQKRFIIEYTMSGLSKGVFEDGDFWAMRSPLYADGDPDEQYSAFSHVAEKFLEECKQHLLTTIGAG
jgi:hypothetical protein